MTRTSIGALMLTAVGVVAANAATVTNPWSGVAGDRANTMGFAFRADAGDFPASIDPLGSLTNPIQLTKVTLTRPTSPDPNNPIGPTFGTGARQLTDELTPVYLDVYTSADAATDSFSGYVGSSSSAVTWNETSEGAPYSFDFANLQLSSSTKYWFAFSEDNVEGESSNFRHQVNTSGNNTTAGPGQGYLVGDAFQILDQGGNPRDWGSAYVVEFTAVPEPSTIGLALVGLGMAIAVRRRGR